MVFTMFVIRDWENQLWLGECPEKFDSSDERFHDGGDLAMHHPITWAFDLMDGFAGDYVKVVDGDRPGSDFISAYLKDEKYASQFEKDLREMGEDITVRVINSWET